MFFVELKVSPPWRNSFWCSFWDANPSRLWKTSQFMFRRKTCFPDLAIYIVIYDMNAGRLSIYMGKIVVFCKAPKKMVSRARSKPLFMKSNFTCRSKIALFHWFWRDRVHLFQKWSSGGPRKRPGRPLSTPGRPGPARVAIGPIKRGTFATWGLTFSIVLRILARNDGFSR